MWKKYKGARLKPVSYDAKIAKAISMSFIKLISGDDNVDYVSDGPLWADTVDRYKIRKIHNNHNYNEYNYQEYLGQIKTRMGIPKQFINIEQDLTERDFTEHEKQLTRLLTYKQEQYKSAYGKSLISKMMSEIVKLLP
jgi:hypothetical protein